MNDHDLQRWIERAGGLYTKAGLAKRWGVSQTIVGKYARRADFPEPFRVNDGESVKDVWLAEEADAWQRKPRRPTE